MSPNGDGFSGYSVAVVLQFKGNSPGFRTFSTTPIFDTDSTGFIKIGATSKGWKTQTQLAPSTHLLMWLNWLHTTADFLGVGATRQKLGARSPPSGLRVASSPSRAQAAMGQKTLKCTHTWGAWARASESFHG